MEVSLNCIHCGKGLSVDINDAKALEKCPFCGAAWNNTAVEGGTISTAAPKKTVRKKQEPIPVAFKTMLSREGDVLVYGLEWGCIVKEFEIPAEIDGRKVVSINDSFSTTKKKLKSVIIGKNIRYIAPYAFAGCKLLTSIAFKGTTEEWNSVKKGEDWIKEVPATQVVCEDGTVALL
ncbi:MAG: hypothetical protein IJX98_05010 [Clostridia bacterium]|nr:hypothetical protein [Clostridia bacterium]